MGTAASRNSRKSNRSFTNEKENAEDNTGSAAYRGTSVDTDHHLITSNVNIRMAKDSKSRRAANKWNLEDFKNEEVKRGKECMKKGSRHNKENQTEKEWSCIKNVTIEAFETNIERMQAKKKTNELIMNTHECLMIKQKREATEVAENQ